jgi:hypothetical protein
MATLQPRALKAKAWYEDPTHFPFQGGNYSATHAIPGLRMDKHSNGVVSAAALQHLLGGADDVVLRGVHGEAKLGAAARKTEAQFTAQLGWAEVKANSGENWFNTALKGLTSRALQNHRRQKKEVAKVQDSNNAAHGEPHQQQDKEAVKVQDANKAVNCEPRLCPAVSQVNFAQSPWPIHRLQVSISRMPPDGSDRYYDLLGMFVKDESKRTPLDQREPHDYDFQKFRESLIEELNFGMDDRIYYRDKDAQYVRVSKQSHWRVAIHDMAILQGMHCAVFELWKSTPHHGPSTDFDEDFVDPEQEIPLINAPTTPASSPYMSGGSDSPHTPTADGSALPPAADTQSTVANANSQIQTATAVEVGHETSSILGCSADQAPSTLSAMDLERQPLISLDTGHKPAGTVTSPLQEGLETQSQSGK